MANGLSHYHVNKLLDRYRGQAWSFPATTYIGLATTAGDATTPGTEVSTSGTGYARFALPSSLTDLLGTNGTTAVSTGTLRYMVNAALMSYGAGNTTASWGTVNHWIWMDALTGGNYLGTAPIDTPLVIASGVPKPEFAAGSFKIQFAALT